MSAIASVPDPLVGRVCALVSDVATQEHSDCRDVAARQLARLTEARARLSAVLVAARAVVDAEDRPRTCPPEVRALRAALSAADGAR